MNRDLIRSNEDVVAVCCTEKGAKRKGTAFNQPLIVMRYGRTKTMRSWVYVAEMSFLWWPGSALVMW